MLSRERIIFSKKTVSLPPPTPYLGSQTPLFRRELIFVSTQMDYFKNYGHFSLFRLSLCRFQKFEHNFCLLHLQYSKQIFPKNLAFCASNEPLLLKIEKKLGILQPSEIGYRFFVISIFLEESVSSLLPYLVTSLARVTSYQLETYWNQSENLNKSNFSHSDHLLEGERGGRKVKICTFLMKNDNFCRSKENVGHFVSRSQQKHVCFLPRPEPNENFIKISAGPRRNSRG